MWRRNPDIDIQQARRDAITGGPTELKRYLYLLWRIHPSRAKDEAYHFEKQGITAFRSYIDLLIELGELEAADKQQALKYMRGQQFAWIFDPTPIDQVREAYPNHEAQCHGDDYPGHCCLSNLIEIYDAPEYVIICRLCQQDGAEVSLGGYTPDNQKDSPSIGLEWVDGGTYSLPCAIPPDNDDYY